MYWRHVVSVEWLKARKDVLTASEIKAMLPEYKRCLKKKSGELSPGFFALCGDKLSVNEPDPVSTGAAARGHILEPYAIEDWNKHHPHEKYEHWDDLVIKRNGIGYSPDGLDGTQTPMMGVELWSNEANMLFTPDKNKIKFCPTRAIEIKCYEPKAHMKNLIVPKEDRDERLQVAVAFMVLPKLKHVDVLWYCPGAPMEMYTERYTRHDLEKEIEVITGMVKIFHEHMQLVKDKINNQARASWTEKQIYDEYIRTQEDSIMSFG